MGRFATTKMVYGVAALVTGLIFGTNVAMITANVRWQKEVDKLQTICADLAQTRDEQDYKIFLLESRLAYFEETGKPISTEVQAEMTKRYEELQSKLSKPSN